MENKYYTPNIEEFHIGFEYEWLDQNNNWIKENSPTEISKDGFNKQTYGLRVKCLNKEDIELFGFELYKTNAGTTTSEFESKDSRYFITFDPNFSDKWNITIMDEVDFVFFHGFIKNKSELAKVLKQIKVGL